jgi:hypothetical protein
MTKYLFWFPEFKIVAGLLKAGLSIDQIKLKNDRENLLQARTPCRSRTIFNAVAARISSLPPEFLDFFEKADFPTQKIINLIAILAYDSLFFDFMYEVYQEKLITGVELMSESDILHFFKNKQAQDETAASWTDATFNRISRAYKGILLRAGLLTKGRFKEWYIEKPILRPELIDMLRKHGMAAFIRAFTGERI